jgi:hypothetical protein
MTQTVRFTHHNRNSRLRYTVAYSFEKNTDGTLNVTYGIAQCRKGDAFSRAGGRKMAEARLHKAAKLAKDNASTSTLLTVPLYGTLTIKDHEGLSVGKYVSGKFETDRRNVLMARERILNK